MNRLLVFGYGLLLGVQVVNGVYIFWGKDKILEEGRQIGLCKAKGGRMIDGKCLRTEDVK